MEDLSHLHGHRALRLDSTPPTSYLSIEPRFPAELASVLSSLDIAAEFAETILLTVVVGRAFFAVVFVVFFIQPNV